MIKDILKAIFPRMLLKKAFSVYNRLKIETIDKIFFPEYVVSEADFLVYRKGYPFRENKVSLDDIATEEVQFYMKNWYDWTQEEFILEFNKPCYIEPDHGWAIVPPRNLLYYSLGISRTGFLRKPGLLKFWRRSKVISVSKAISLRDSGEENYLHFYNDVLTKLFFLKSSSIDFDSVPLIISKKLWEKQYFQYYLDNNAEIKSLHWLIQDDEFVRCESSVFCKALTHRKDFFTQIFTPLYKPGNFNKRIFISRSKGRLRHIKNSDEVESMLIKYGFETVDADHLSTAEQIDAFVNAGIIVGVHGAGLTNLMFRNGSCEILEIFPYPEEGYLPFHYIMLAKMKGFFYDGLIGERNKTQFSDGFLVDPIRLEVSLKRLL